MDPARFEPSYLLGLALEQQWPAMFLSFSLCAVAWLSRIERVPESLRTRFAWLTAPGVLIAAPVYSWACGAALESIRVMEMLARSTVAWPQAISFIDTIWAIHLSQFVALFCVFLPVFATALAGKEPIKTRDVAGIVWAVAAVAVDTLFLLRVVTPIGPSAT